MTIPISRLCFPAIFVGLHWLLWHFHGGKKYVTLPNETGAIPMNQQCGLNAEFSTWANRQVPLLLRTAMSTWNPRRHSQWFPNMVEIITGRMIQLIFLAYMTYNKLITKLTFVGIVLDYAVVTWWNCIFSPIHDIKFMKHVALRYICDQFVQIVWLRAGTREHPDFISNLLRSFHIHFIVEVASNVTLINKFANHGNPYFHVKWVTAVTNES